jgi:two-component system cell cycle sensor histidine kinase/response regulator CckA
MPYRYTDIVNESSELRDFVIRQRFPSLGQLMAVFLATLVVSISALVLIFNAALLISVLCIVLGVAGWYVIVQVQRSRDLVLATEFQNAMFTSALGFNNKFCLIIKRDGGIVYIDNAFQELFPDAHKERHLSVSSLLRYGKVDEDEQERVFAAIARGVYDKVIFDIRGADNQPARVVMSIEPISRPAGFTLLRCREFVERNSSAPQGAFKPANPLLSKSTITLFSYVMDKMNMGVYMSDPAGNIVYANPVLEHWLGFGEGEVTSGNLALRHIIYQDTGDGAPGDYEGEVRLQKKAGGLVRVFINQKIIHGENDKTLGCVAVVHYIGETSTDEMKSSW